MHSYGSAQLLAAFHEVSYDSSWVPLSYGLPQQFALRVYPFFWRSIFICFHGDFSKWLRSPVRAVLANCSFGDIPQGPERCLRIAGMFLMANELGPQWLPIQKNVCVCVCTRLFPIILEGCRHQWIIWTSCLVSFVIWWFSSVQSLSRVQLFATPWIAALQASLVHHQLPESTQTHVHQVGDAIQPSHPLSSPSPPAPNPSQHQNLFQWVNSSHEVAKVLEFQL